VGFIEMLLKPRDQLTGEKSTYIVQEQLSSGRFAITYLVRDSTGKGLVIKGLNSDLLNSLSDTESNALRSQFKDESIKLARCKHPNIVRLIDTGFSHSSNWIALEY
jgi:serine/threonine-protein kinase